MHLQCLRYATYFETRDGGTIAFERLVLTCHGFALSARTSEMGDNLILPSAFTMKIERDLIASLPSF